MTIKGMMLRFFLVYPVLLIAAGLLMKYTGYYSLNTGLGFGILVGCVIWLCGSFGKKNGRYFTAKEKNITVIGFAAIDLFFQLLFGVAALSQIQASNKATAIFIAIAVLSIVRAIAIYIFVGVAGKSLVKQGVIAG